MEDPIIDTWRTHCRLQLFLIEAILPEVLSGKLAPRGRSVGQIIAHVHNNRLNWMEHMALDLIEGLAKVKRGQYTDKALLLGSLRASGEAIERLLERSLEAGGKVRGFRGHAVTFAGYMIAHDSYHHGEISITLTQAGYPLDRKIAYGIWDWRSPKKG